MFFFQAHPTDSALGRTGTTLDWPNSISDFDPAAWNNCDHAPPHGTNWRDHLTDDIRLFSRNAVKPFAIYFEWECNLILLADELMETTNLWHDTLTDIELGEVVFGRKCLRYWFGSLSCENLLASGEFSAQNQFSRFNARDYHIHGTRVQRREETSDQLPQPIEVSLSFSSIDEFRNARVNLTRLVPTHLEFQVENPPKLFSIGPDVFVSDEITSEIIKAPHPGVSFPFPAISVEFKPI